MMRLSVSFLVLGLFALGGCSPNFGKSPGAQSSKAGTLFGAEPRRHSGSDRPAIASLPDNGDLLRYDSVRKIEPSGAYTSYPVTLSEAHAFRSLSGGELVLTAPDGERLHLQPQRHEEYPDGNWTLVARDRKGTSSLLTFGQDAVFGSVTRADGSVLRVTTRNRQVYLVAADPEQLARLENPDESERVDMLMPPHRAAAAGANRVASSGQSQAQAQTNVGIAAANDIDVLMGYTNGLVARIGSESGAITRMQNLVAISNEAYTNSGVTSRLRLVRAMLVNYTDNNTNQIALQSLTGSSGTGSVAIDPAFNALRAARDEVGADLVSLVRQFREPENDGCGIAWLLGGGPTPITQNDASFGYSVVSDGSDVRENDGRTYFCRDETFAHELGHNMGQAHNQEDARDGGGSLRYGAHTYSFGYREATTNGFYTVMAYRLTDSSQIGIRNFANPSVSVSGRPTGVADQSDNVRSMNQTMPLIAGFRASTIVEPSTGIVPVDFKNDVNGDGRSDLLFLNSGTRQFSYRLMNGSTTLASGIVNGLSPGYRIAATGDFDADGRVDIVWTSANLDLYIWLGNGTPSTAVGTYPSGWEIVAAADINADGRSDLLFHNATSRQFSYRLMNGLQTTASGIIGGVGAGYRIATVGDFDNDNRADIIWTSSNRDIYMWLGNGTPSTQVGSYPAGWEIVGSGDVNADGRSDLLFLNTSARQFSYRLMNGLTTTSSGLIGGLTAGYRVATTGDFDNDGRVDIVWTSDNRDLYMWPGNGGATAGVGTYPSGWVVTR